MPGMPNPERPAKAYDRTDTEIEESSALDFIAEARRPILIQRHRQVIEDMEVGLSDALITGQTDHKRFKAMLEELDRPDQVERMRIALKALTEDPHHREANLRRALVEELCLSRERGQGEVVGLQLQAIGIYRLVRNLLLKRQGEAPGLDEMRELPAAQLGQLMAEPECTFAQPVLGVLRTKGYEDHCLRTIKRLRKLPGADEHWQDAAGEITLTRDEEAPLLQLPQTERIEARKLLVRDRLRSRFYRAVFLGYFAADEFDPREAEGHPTVLHWLQAVHETPHLYPFTQGQSAGQKAFRVGRLLEKVVQLHEIYARVAHAAENPAHREQMAGKGIRERLQIITRAHYPPLPMSPDLTLAALLCPFGAFVRWVQERVAANDFILPPDPKR